MQTTNIVDENIKRIGELFPNCLTERLNDEGKPEVAIDFDQLRQELSKDIVEGPEERYQFTWPDKRNAIRLANAPTTDTLRPCREESVDFDNTQNLYIEGDNLQVLKVLRECYLGEVDVIYVDPPYNTGRNLIYKNDYSVDSKDYHFNSGQTDELGNLLTSNPESNGRFHTDWLNMIYPRIKVAKDVLKDSGIFVLTIDDCEIQTVTMLLNEIFGAENHLGTIVVKNNPSGRSTTNGVSIAHEYALFYRKNSKASLGRLPRNEKQIARYKEKDEIGPFEWVNFRARYSTNSPKMAYPILIKKDGSDFRIPNLEWNEKEKNYNINDVVNEDEFISLPIDDDGNMRSWKWSIQTVRDNRETEMNVRQNQNGQYAVYVKSRMNQEGMLPLTVWDDTKYSSTEYGTNFLTELMGKRYFDYPKSIYAVIDSLKVANAGKNALVLDFFSGSATTAQAVMMLNAEDGGNRKFIMVQVPEKTEEDSDAYREGYKTICDIGKQRVRVSGNKIIKDLDKERTLFSSDKNIYRDFGFRVLKLDSSNMQDVYYTPSEFNEQKLFDDNIKPDRTEEDLLFQTMIDLGIELSAKIEKRSIAGKTVWSVSDGYLMACFDEEVNETTITEIARQQPYYFVMRDSSLANDQVADNFEQIWEEYSKDTVRKII